ncbi:protein of unknown function [Burkholderia multivorans]
MRRQSGLSLHEYVVFPVIAPTWPGCTRFFAGWRLARDLQKTLSASISHGGLICKLVHFRKLSGAK